MLGVCAALLVCARARAFGQFSTPYDPDFAPSKTEEPDRTTPKKPRPPAPAAPGEAAGTPFLTLPPGMNFLLLDRPDAGHIFEQAGATAPATTPDFEAFEERLKTFEYSPEKYATARAHLEQGIFLEETAGVIQYVSGQPVFVSTETPKPPPPEVELPTYGTSLSVTGRKVIGFNYSEKRFIGDQSTTGRPQTTNLIDISQQLQLRMQGKVGPKITVNVDYDDTKVNHQDISVVYTGDPNEVVQNVSFGDIDLSLPATEFVSYNKQLFGIRADIKYKGLKASFIGSRTKGTTKSKQFFGNTQFVATDVPDTGYVRRTYYDLAFGLRTRLPIRVGSERVYAARQIQGQVNVTDIANMTANDLAAPSSSFTATYSPLNPGIDYTIDYAKGIITFRNQLQPQFAVAIDFIDSSGNALSVQQSTTSTAAGAPTCVEPPTAGALANQPCPKLIKTPSDLPIVSSATEVGFNRELKTFYNVGQTQIVRDNGRGNFILRVIDPATRNEVGSTLNPPQAYPQTINMDFENGIFNLLQPFAVPGDSSTVDSQIYAITPISRRLIHLEYSYRFKTFFLEPNLVPQSEVVLLDNVKLNRNVDYFIDYDAGFITFFNEDRIQAQSEIDITYEVAPFAGVTDESLLGTRVSYDFNKHFSLGSTLLYESGTKSPTTPQITELAKSLLVYDFDSQWHDIKLSRKLMLKAFTGELAQSHQDLNLNSFALIDNMEGIKQEDTAGTLATQWYVASQPGAAGVSDGTPANPTHLSWLSEDVPVLQVNPHAQATSQDSQKALDLSYSSLAVNEEVSIVYPFSTTGNDFSQKTILQVTLLGDNSQNQINFRLGGVSEDADGTGGTTLNCSDGRVLVGAPKTEDVDCDGVLQPGEDIGWLYSPASLPSTRFGAGNGRIDTEDLNANGRLDPDDANGNNFGFAPDLTGTNPTNNVLHSLSDGANHTAVDFVGAPGGGWQVLQIPLNINPQALSRWTNIKNIRITIRRTAAGNASGTIKFAHIGVIGNSWQPGIASDPLTPSSAPIANESMIVTPINNVDNPAYVPIYNAGGDASQVFSDLYGSLANLQKQSNTQNISEQALELSFSSMTIQSGVGLSSAVVTTKRVFPRPIDISQHRYFNFLLYGNAQAPLGAPCAPAGTNGSPNCTDHTFFLRVGNDANFFEVQVPINFVGWKKIRVRQDDTAHNAVADNWQADTAGTTVISTGVPSLQQVAEIVAGVRRTGSATAGSPTTQTSGIVLLNEIHVAQPMPRVGTAKKIGADFDLAGWATFGAKYRSVDRNFQTPTSVVSNQDNEQDSAYLNFTRMRFFPLTFNLQRSITETPNTFQTGQLSNTINLLQQGKVTTWTGSAQGNFSLGALPRVNLSHTRNRIEYELLTRLDDRKAYNATIQYGVPVNRRYLPKTIDLNIGYMNYDVTFQSPSVLKFTGNANTHEMTRTSGLRMSFAPWNGASFNPNYSLTKATERRADFTGPSEVDLAYTKSRAQTAGFSSNIRLRSWLNPQVNYSIDTLENNILTVSTFIVSGATYVFNVGDIKTVNRSANGAISLPLTIGEIFPRVRLTKSLTIVSGYQLQDGDVWNNVENGLNSLSHLWIRSGLNPRNPAATLASRNLRDTYNSTQRWSPLESFNLPGRWAPLKTFSVSNNFVRSVQRQSITGTDSKTISTTIPDLVASVSQLEKLWRTERFMSSTQMNFKYAAHRIQTIDQTDNRDHSFGSDLRSIIVRRFDTLLSFNDRYSNNKNLQVDANTQVTAHQDATAQVTFDVGKFRFTPKTDYTHDTTALGTGVKTQDLTVVTPSMLVRADLALPRGLVIPGTSKTLLFTNRVIWTTTMSLAIRSSPVTIIDNSKLASLTTSADYELAKNLRMTLNGAVSRLWHKFLPTEDYISYQMGTTLTFQF